MKKQAAILTSALLLSMASLAKADSITISAASSLGDAFTEISDNFTNKTGIKVSLNFASSNALLRQIEGGAPVDIFATADQMTMDSAAQKSLLIPESRHNFALNELVLITPTNAEKIKDLKILTEAKIKLIAVGKPDSVPAGRYARSALLAVSLWKELEHKFIFSNNVRQALSYVQRGEVDAGIVYRTDALSMPDKVSICLTLKNHEPVSYPIALLKESQNKKSAEKFIEYIFSEYGQDTLRKYGFTPLKK